MTAQLARPGWWLTIAYCLTAVLAQGTHTHHGITAEPAHCHGSSQDPGPRSCSDEGIHFDAMPVGHGESIAGGCPSCQFQLSHLAWLDQPSGTIPTDGGNHVTVPIVADPSRSSLLPRGRSPPIG